MMYATRVLPLVALLCYSTPAVARPEDLQHDDVIKPLLHTVSMDQQGDFMMSWTPTDDDIVIELTVTTRGYVGLGFSPNGGMKGADIVMAWVDDNEQMQLTDRYATGNMSPMVDDSQDVQLLSGRRNDTHTTVRFRRPLVTCDDDNDVTITGDTAHVIYAYGKQTPEPGSSTLPYHAVRGTRSLYLKEQQMDTLEMTEDVQHWDIKTDNISLPDTLPTLYWCSVHKIPPLNQKHHIIKYEPLISAASRPFVHHFILYECKIENSSLFLEPWVGHAGTQCHTANMPLSFSACQNIVVGWGVGSEGTSTPAEAGVPMGKEWGGITYFLLETHYNNPTKIQNIRDSSGLRVYHTAKLRQHDLGVLMTGHAVDPLMIIGPHSPDWLVVGHCSSNCTKELLPSEGVHVTGGVLHSHLLGTSLKVQHIRDGKELAPIIQDEHYDFNYQQEHYLSKPRLVLPGDHLIVNCLYDASAKNMTSFGGLGTQEEMCLSFLTYYPRNENFYRCLSRPSVSSMTQTMGVKLYKNNHPMRTKQLQSDVSELANKIDDEKERLHRKALAAGEIQMDEVNFYYALYLMKIEQPRVLQNVSLLEMLMSDAMWANPEVAVKLRHFMSGGPYEQRCQNNILNSDNVAEELQYPEFEPYVPRVKPCFNTKQTQGLENSEQKDTEDREEEKQKDMQDREVEKQANEVDEQVEEEIVNKNHHFLTKMRQMFQMFQAGRIG